MIINWSKDLDSVPLLEELCRGPGPPRMLWVEYHWMMLMAFICWCWYVYLIICCYVDMLMLIWWFADMLMLIYHICWYVDTLICWYAQVGAGDKFKPFLRWCQNCFWDNCQVSSVKNCFWEESFHTHGTLSWEGDSWKLPRVSAKCWTSTCWNTTRNLRTYLKTHSGTSKQGCPGTGEKFDKLLYKSGSPI